MTDVAATFVRNWMNPDYPPERVSLAALAKAEKQLKYKFPTSYTRLVCDIGLLSPTTGLLDTIVDRGALLNDLGEFLSPDQVVASTRDWRAMGMPDHLVAFASDSGGSLYCFDANADENDDAVWFFDHDLDESERLFGTLDSWLMAYNELKG